ncbi:MAG: sigma-54-dependent Fis family transcriptional regulator [Ignavibacterium sp.]|nr:sigma-54-dependent Fis family transcriptional regulator [Ignavibacterium sp.]
MNELKLESLIELATILAKQNDYQETLRLVTEKASGLLNAKTTLIMMINPRTRETVKTLYKDIEESENESYKIVHTYLCGWTISHNTGFLTENIREDSRFNRELFEDINLQSVMCVPFTVEGVIIGTLLLLNKYKGYVFTKSDFLFLEKFTAIVSPYLRDVQKIQQYFTAPLPLETLQKKYEVHGLLGKSKKFIQLLQTIESAARCDVRVLLDGQSGTGKELIAKAIHQYSSRNNQKFVAVDCGAIPANLIESELFGHVKGAFTGANFSRKGLLEEANGGTFFMDEINNLPMELQAKLLRFLQENEIRPIGSNETIKVDVRIIAASSVSLKQLVEEKKFREDLFYRLYVYPIPVPSLNERIDDIPLLANYFLKKCSLQQKKNIEMFHEEILDFLKNHSWVGNIRELENFVERLVTLAPLEMQVIDASILPADFQEEWQEVEAISPKYDTSNSLEKNILDYEIKLIKKVLEECNWNQSKAARQLNISETTIRYKMNKLGISRTEK